MFVQGACADQTSSEITILNGSPGHISRKVLVQIMTWLMGKFIYLMDIMKVRGPGVSYYKESFIWWREPTREGVTHDPYQLSPFLGSAILLCAINWLDYNHHLLTDSYSVLGSTGPTAASETVG